MYSQITDFFNKSLLYKIFDNSLIDYGKGILIIIFGILIIWIIKHVLLPKLHRFIQNTKLSIDDFFIISIKKQLIPLLYFITFYLSIQHLNINSKIIAIINKIGFLIVIIVVTRFLTGLILFIIRQHLNKNSNDSQKKNAFSVIKTAVTIIFWAIAIILFLDNIGIKITGLITGLGIGGVAVAFAAQALLKDIFSYFSIFLDKPFEIGDFIIIDNFMGTVEYIGIKTTRVKSLSGERLIFPNADLTNSRIRNYKHMEERRIAFTIGITYETPVSDMKVIPDLIKSIIEERDNTRFDRCHFSSYGDFNLLYETVYYVNTNDYNIYMDTQQYINLRIKEEFEKLHIDFAYPTQLLYMERKR